MKRNLDSPKVKDIITKDVIAFPTNFTQVDAIKTFNKHRISSAPVIDDNHVVIGYLSESDCIKCMSNCLFYDEARNVTIDSLMSKSVKVANPEWDVFELENFFIQNNIKSAPVVDSEGHLAGIVARRDILVALENFAHSRDEYKEQAKKPFELNQANRVKMILSQD